MLDRSDLDPVLDFLQRHAPYSALDPLIRESLARLVRIEYLRRGARLALTSSEEARIYLVRSGAIREAGEGGALLAHYGEGDTFGAFLVMAQAAAPDPPLVWQAMEDTLLYSVASSEFRELGAHAPLLGAFFEGQRLGLRSGEAIFRARERLETGGLAAQVDALSTRVSSLLQGSIVQIAANQSIRAAARRMSEARVSSVVVVSAAERSSRGELLGIVTDRDLRNRVVAEGRSADDPVRTIMSTPVVTITPEASLMQALVVMVEHGVHHLVVLEEGRPVGVVTLTDWMRARAENPVYLLNDIQRQSELGGLVAVSAQRPRVLVQLVEAGIGCGEVHAVLTSLEDAITRRLIALVSRELRDEGLEVPQEGWCWVAFGSQARHEGSLHSDQDNGLILSDHLEGAAPGLVALAERVCAGLDACGYSLCRGGTMASRESCRKPLHAWRREFRGWIDEPSRAAVLRGAIFCDSRAIDGRGELLSGLQRSVIEGVTRRPLFVAHLARDALARRPPLGFFRQLVVEPSGEHRETLDMKRRGVIPIVDLARVYALESGCAQPGTRARLRWARQHGRLNESSYEEVSEALDIVQRERLRHHVRCVKSARPVDDHLRPAELSGVERRQLRDAFRVVGIFQGNLEHSHQLGNLSG